VRTHRYELAEPAAPASAPAPAEGARPVRIEPPIAALPPETAACIGAFDGMHRGHQALLDQARSMAPHLAVVTFEPHPSAVLAPDRAPVLLQTPPQRERVCAALGVDDLVLLPFGRPIAALAPDAFVRAFVTEGLRPAALVVGDDFRFGHRRAGGVDDLRAMCEAAGIAFAAIPQVTDDDHTRLSSTAVRRLVSEGRVADAADMLDRWYAVEGVVRPGAARGRDLGFPTANVASDNALVPREGVYASVLSIVDESSSLCGRTFASVTNVGYNPTFADGASTTTGVEVHALDVDLGESLYGIRVEVGFVARLRDETKFSGAAELEAAIRDDIARARPLLDDAALARLPRPVPSTSSETV
jgi:riboflavin kinase/FMN adenylyltransferase